MRVSNLTHETAIKKSNFYAQEIPNVYERLTQRIGGIDMASKFNEDYFVNDLPYMFKDWTEYRDYLLENLTQDKYKKYFKGLFKRNQNTYGRILEQVPELLVKCRKAQIQSILTNDWEGTKMENFETITFVSKVQTRRIGRS